MLFRPEAFIDKVSPRVDFGRRLLTLAISGDPHPIFAQQDARL